MKNHLLKPIATNSLRGFLVLALWAVSTLALAGPVAGTVVQLSGPLLAKKANGATKILSLKSEVENGDTLITEKNTYAMVKMIDNSTMTLRPATSMTIENFSFDDGKPEGDEAKFNLVKGGLRSVTGLLGKRSKEKFALKTPVATIGIRGTTFIVNYSPPLPPGAGALLGGGLPPGAAPPLAPPSSSGGKAPAAPVAPTAPPGPPPGLHIAVQDGAIMVQNPGGTAQFSAGQFGYVPSVTQPPVVVPPNNPGLQFTPPPSFNSSTGPTASSGPGQGSAVDCVVR
ncbi:FecR family protein [Massilia endophytica]|uniref:FecR family protein n=1 Tax=Massilia endophytica TaxID=2899220 RepID=UPI001E52C09D|nr:FecR family protein [Massilia endophytica]UGQ45005.1 FecR family protein [Massilia endophytica]